MTIWNMASVNMVLGNMTKVKTLFKKGYLLAGVIMAANMFVVNEMMAMDSQPQTTNTQPQQNNILTDINNGLNSIEQKKNPNVPGNKFKKNILDRVLSLENTINLAVGLVSSGANNYFKWWDYNAGSYRKLGCFGWRSGRFLKDIFQLDINLNVGRGILWLIPTIFGSYQYLRKKLDPRELTATAAVIINSYKKGEKSSDYSVKDCILFFFLSSFQGFVSMPLAIHISNFSIAVSIDSILWELVTKVCEKKDKGKKEEKLKDEEEKDNKEQSE